MPTDYLLIDLENVSPDWIPNLLENQAILIFTGSRQIKINRKLVISTQPFGKQIQWIEIEGNGKNALDFHIAYYMGEFSKKEPTASFTNRGRRCFIALRNDQNLRIRPQALKNET